MFSATRRKRSHKKCIIRNCDVTDGSFYEFPGNVETHQVWLEKVEPFADTENIRDRSVVCEAHFKETDFMEGSKKRLKSDAVPSVFMMRVQSSVPRLEKATVPSTFPNYWSSTPEARQKKAIVEKDVSQSSTDENVTEEDMPQSDSVKNFKTIKRITHSSDPNSADNISLDLFSKLYTKNCALNLPSPAWSVNPVTENQERFVLISEMCVLFAKPVMKRQVVIAPNMKVSLYIGNNSISRSIHRLVNQDQVMTKYDDIERLIYNFSLLEICYGGPSIEQFPEKLWKSKCATVDSSFNCWRHSSCTFVFRSSKKCCDFCLMLFQTFSLCLKRGSRFLEMGI